MTTSTATKAAIATAMFTVSDQDAALAFYSGTLGWEVRSDIRFGAEGESRWLEVAPPGSVARLALNPPMGGTPGGAAIGIEVADVLAEHARLRAIGGVDLDPEPMQVEGAPLMFALRENGARLCLPAILDKTTIVFRELVRGAALVEMGFGTAGPGDDAETLDPDIMLVPLAAFDSRGHRIGYGAGYYDRAIERLTEKGHAPRLIGIAFGCQEVPKVPDEPHDVVIPEILTEGGLRRFGPPL